MDLPSQSLRCRKLCRDRRRADERQSQRDVDAVIERKVLIRISAVVIHADRAVVGFSRALMKHGIGRQGAAHVDVFGAQFGNGRRDDGLILFAKGPVLAGVRIEPGNCDARIGDSKSRFQIGNHDARGFYDEVAGEICDGVAQRQVNRHRHHCKRWRPQHHHRHRRLAAWREFGEIRCGRDVRSQIDTARSWQSDW